MMLGVFQIIFRRWLKISWSCIFKSYPSHAQLLQTLPFGPCLAWTFAIFDLLGSPFAHKSQLTTAPEFGAYATTGLLPPFGSKEWASTLPLPAHFVQTLRSLRFTSSSCGPFQREPGCGSALCARPPLLLFVQMASGMLSLTTAALAPYWHWERLWETCPALFERLGTIFWTIIRLLLHVSFAKLSWMKLLSPLVESRSHFTMLPLGVGFFSYLNIAISSERSWSFCLGAGLLLLVCFFFFFVVSLVVRVMFFAWLGCSFYNPGFSLLP